MIGTIKEVMDMFNNTYSDHQQLIWLNWTTKEEVEDAHGDDITDKQYSKILDEIDRYGNDDVNHQINEALYQVLESGSVEESDE